MKLFSSKKRVAAIGAITAATLVTGGVAVAYWTTTGTGQGTATTSQGDATGWEVTVTNTDTKNLAPTTFDGDPVQNVTYTITNTGSGQQNLAKAVISVASVTAGSGSPACSVADFAVGGEATGGASHEQLIGSNLAVGGVYEGSVELRLLDNGANQDDCKSQTVTIQVDAS